MEKDTNKTMDKLVALCKRRGFIYQGSELYGGLAGTWDYGPLGNELKFNIEQLWWEKFVLNRDDIYGISSAILMNEKVWEASGHTGAGFSDPLVECRKCKKRYRRDHLPAGKAGLDGAKECPECGGELGEERQFNLMFKTHMGAQEETVSYLRPETAQGIFVNFKNIIDSFHPKLPFGIAQIGKAFRNEIAPREFLFRVREFEQMEIEYFVRESEWEKYFEEWRKDIWEWIDEMGISRGKVREFEVPKEDLAHYSKRTIDFEYDYSGKGYNELLGLAYRTDFDLSSHAKHSGTDLVYTDEDGTKFIPHVLEPSFGVGRAMLAVLLESYTEDELGGEKRVVLKLPKRLAPIKVAVFPLLKNKPELVKKAREVYKMIKKGIPQSAWDDNGNIGKRYRRQDEIGTPYCVTIDFDTLDDGTVTIRDRDSGKQRRVSHKELLDELAV